jgi:hypothetical protein
VGENPLADDIDIEAVRIVRATLLPEDGFARRPL